MRKYPLTKTAKIIYSISGILCCIWVLLLWQRNWVKDQNLKTQGIIANGAIILSINRYGNRLRIYNVEYGYKFKEKLYTQKMYITLIANEYLASIYFVGKMAPVIIDTTFPSRSMLLLSRKDFENFGLQRPDSLYWYDSILNANKRFLDF